MKKIYSCLLILTFFTSCNDDLNTHQEVNTNTIASRAINEVFPLNNDNPYDNVGQLHDDLFETYYASGNLPSDIYGIINRVESIANSNNTFISMKGANYQTVAPQRVQYILEHKNTCIADIISNSSMTTAAKVSLADFVNSLIQYFPTEFSGDVLSDFVVKYENTIIASPLFTTNDKRIMLITTSVARHSTYMARKKPKKNTDPDWIIFVGNIIAATEGAEDGYAKAVTLALATGIAQN
ncbi:MAG: hypothetical protein ABIQ27_10655 [Flavobacterium sp.]|uniref:hypothetical protein n=1 Tax=Flavobacterium sp. TaxID=239 RepID=UPI003266C2B1